MTEKVRTEPLAAPAPAGHPGLGIALLALFHTDRI